MFFLKIKIFVCFRKDLWMDNMRDTSSLMTAMAIIPVQNQRKM